jgi:RNA polymerase sigma-70 factor, ECF subfamily
MFKQAIARSQRMVSRSRFEELVIRHRNSAFNLAYWILRRREDAEDAEQDAYVRAFRAFDTFAGAGERAWLLAIVRNVAYSALDARKRSRKVITLGEEPSLGDGLDAVSQDPSPEAVVIVREGQQSLRDALTRLPPIHRDILVLREMEGLSYAEISQITGTAIGTVMSRLSRARAELLRQLREPLDKSRAVLKGRQNSKFHRRPQSSKPFRLETHTPTGPEKHQSADDL